MLSPEHIQVAVVDAPHLSSYKPSDGKTHGHVATTDLSDLGGVLAKKKRNIQTAAGFRRFLIHEYGFEYVPKTRIITVPQDELAAHPHFHQYLRRSSFRDPFEDHDERKAWQKELEDIIDSDLIAKVIINDNQLTRNAIGAILAYARLLERRNRNEPILHEKLNSTYQTMLDTYGGEDTSFDSAESTKEAANFYDALPFDGKLSVVHGLTDCIATALWHFAQHTNENPIPVRLHVTGTPRRRGR